MTLNPDGLSGQDTPGTRAALTALIDIAPLARTLEPALADRIAHKTKPPGSLGMLETLALQIGLIQQTLAPTVNRPAMLVFAADHGIAAEGVSPFPQAVTQQMVANFVAGGAAINVFSGLAGFELEVINAGVAGDLSAMAGVIDVPVARGTRNFAREAAMSHAQLEQALLAGAARALACAAGQHGIGLRRDGHRQHLGRRLPDEPPVRLAAGPVRRSGHRPR